LLGSYGRFKDSDRICIVDDDIIYRPDMLARLLAKHDQHPHAIVSSFKDGEGSPTGFSGYLFTRQVLELNAADIDDLHVHCSCVDDTWLGKVARKKGVAVIGLSTTWHSSMDLDATQKHPAWFELCEQPKRQEQIRQCLEGEVQP
jgi:hypothetical protein